MLIAKLKIEKLYRIYKLLRVARSDIIFNIDKEMIKIKALDPAHVFMYEVNLTKEAFLEYKFAPPDNEDKDKIGIDLDEIYSCISTYFEDNNEGYKYKNSVATLNLDEKSNIKLDIEGTVIRSENTVITRTLKWHSIDHTKEAKLPNLGDNQVSFQVDDIPLFYLILNDIHINFTHAILKTVEGNLAIHSVDGSDDVMTEATMIIEQKENYRDGISAKYAPDYISKIIKSLIDIAPSIELKYNNDYPCIIAFDHDGINGEMMLAPRIESV